jgi:hypothetical protein
MILCSLGARQWPGKKTGTHTQGRRRLRSKPGACHDLAGPSPDPTLDPAPPAPILDRGVAAAPLPGEPSAPAPSLPLGHLLQRHHGHGVASLAKTGNDDGWEQVSRREAADWWRKRAGQDWGREEPRVFTRRKER